jgi:hypothetical protein
MAIASDARLQVASAYHEQHDRVVHKKPRKKTMLRIGTVKVSVAS